jgi:hypothetical protein
MLTGVTVNRLRAVIAASITKNGPSTETQQQVGIDPRTGPEELLQTDITADKAMVTEEWITYE